MSKKTKPYYLKKYQEWMVTGELPNCNGLCKEISPYLDNYFVLFIPNVGDMADLTLEKKSTGYWASYMESATNLHNRRDALFTPLRQNIVLFMAAMNGEL